MYYLIDFHTIIYGANVLNLKVSNQIFFSAPIDFSKYNECTSITCDSQCKLNTPYKYAHYRYFKMYDREKFQFIILTRFYYYYYYYVFFNLKTKLKMQFIP